MGVVLLSLALQPPADRLAIDPDRLHFRGIEDDAPVRGEAENRLEYEAYNAVLLHARQFTTEEALAGADRGVEFRDLVLPVRQDFRLKLVALDGRLLRLRKYEATRPLRDAGVPHLYEGWLVPDAGSAPLCFLATDPPPGLEPSQRYADPPPVTAAGWVFKLMRYESSEPMPGDANRGRVRKAPLLMGRSLIVRPRQPAAGFDPWAGVPAVAAVVGGLAAVGLGLTAWYRLGDRTARRLVSDRRNLNPFDAPSPGGPTP